MCMYTYWSLHKHSAAPLTVLSCGLNVFDPLIPGGVVHPYQLDLSIVSFRDAWCIFSFVMYFAEKFVYANNVDPDQTQGWEQMV